MSVLRARRIIGFPLYNIGCVPWDVLLKLFSLFVSNQARFNYTAHDQHFYHYANRTETTGFSNRNFVLFIECVLWTSRNRLSTTYSSFSAHLRDISLANHRTKTIIMWSVTSAVTLIWTEMKSDYVILWGSLWMSNFQPILWILRNVCIGGESKKCDTIMNEFVVRNTL